MAAVRPDVPEAHLRDAQTRLAEFFRTQGAVVAAHLGKTAGRKASVDEVFAQPRWDQVLLLEVLAIALATSQSAGRSVLAGLGLAAADYDADRTRAWLRQHASGVASGINGVTKVALRDALRAGLSADKVRELFDSFATARAPQIAQTEVTAAAGFGTQEAARQSEQTLTKTWHTGARPRSSHAAINGQTVPIPDQFSNGARWPGDSLLPNEERARCNCVMSVDTAG